jgi:hypothetical protein
MPTKGRSIRPSTEPDAAQQYKPGSLSIFEFTPDDLKANQRGYLTDRQRGWLQGTARGITSCSIATAPIALGLILLGLSITLGLFLSNEDSRRVLFSNPMNLLGFAAAGVVGVSAVGLSIMLARRQASGVQRAQLQAAQGAIRLDQDYSPGSTLTSYHVYVGDHKFSFTDDMSSVFREGAHYRVYYCKSGPYQLIMSFKQLGE